MPETASLRSHLLIAMPGMADPSFNHTVTLVCQHDHHGAMGITVNRPLDITIGSLFSQLDIKPENPELSLKYALGGGPIQPDRGFVLHDNMDGLWETSMGITEGINLTASRDILLDIAKGTGPENFLLALGYAGWEAGQLEEEMMNNAWLTCPVNEDILFRMPYGERWRGAAGTLGIDVNLISDVAGHA